MTTVQDSQLKNRIAKAVFSAAESTGIADRQVVEQMIEQVIQRLDWLEPIPVVLPGWEDLVSTQSKRPKVSEAEIQAKVKEVLAEISLAPVREAPAETKKKGRKAKPKAEAIKLSANARVVLERRYLKKGPDGKPIETPEEMLRRVAHTIASAEKIYHPKEDTGDIEEEFYQLMANLEFLPNSPTLMNAGRELGQLSACFVLPVEDSMESIFDAVKHTAMIHKSGGGTGFSFTRLRPESDRVGSTGGVASGPVSFIKAFDAATDVIKQGGTRRGANMGILNVDHPDIMTFITCKEKQNVLNNFNISVAATEKFMKAVEEDTDYDLINPRTKEVSGRLSSRAVFDQMIDFAWRNGDPGIVFLDRINRDNPTPHLGAIESTNPCGEQPLLPYESCNLGSVNLAKMIGEAEGSPVIDWDKLSRTVRTAIRFLDNVIDMNNFPLPQIAEMTRKTRKVGLGIMGFADMLIRLGIPYDSDEALKTGEHVMEFVDKEALAASIDLAKERGAFPAFKGSVYDKPRSPKVRNATRTTIAPTGTLSIIANCSGGIEPLFALSYFRQILDNDKLVEVNSIFEEVAKKEEFYSEELMKTLAEKGKVRGIEGIPEWVQEVFVVSHDIPPEVHIKMQAAFQRHTDNAVSKTINFANHATRQDVANAYMMAYKEGCKGITIYRDGSRDVQVLNIAGKKSEKAEQPEKPAEDEGSLTPRERPNVTFGVTEKMTTGCGTLYITVNSDEQGICEVFTLLGKSGGCAAAQLEAISRLTSMSLRAGVPVESVVKHLRGIRCSSIAWDRGHAVLSCADAIGTVLERQLSHKMPYAPQNGNGGSETHEENNGAVKVINPTGVMGGQCPECSGLLVFQEGCHICYGCGYTKCV
ncbi:MAG: vitamin B12-dependent ribonucleotide reductase [Dehalococcoidia bacterium]|nr:vitamin B12-dependent ribonucleotide reductase [Dehalococcoidia bacterium]